MKATKLRPWTDDLSFPARKELRLHFAVLVSVDTTNPDLVDQVRSVRHGTIEKTVGDEIKSNLESLTYVRHVSVQLSKGDNHHERNVLSE